MPWTRRVEDRLRNSATGSHLVRATKRYFNRLGNQLAGAIAFFSILALVPILMFAFSAVGLTLTVIRPDLMDEVQLFIVDNLNAGPLQDQVLMLLAEYLYHWRRVGLFALGVALVIGTTWVANLKGAIRGMGRPDFTMVHRRHSVLLEPVFNIIILLVFMVLMAVTFTSTVIGTQLAGRIVDWLRVGNVHISRGLVRGASLTLSMLGAFGMFWLLYRFLPDERSPARAIVRGSLGAAASFVLLQAGASFLTNWLSLSRSTQVFGPVIVAMLFINFFAQLILFWAAWIATHNQPAVARRYSPADLILREDENAVLVDHHWEFAEADLQRRRRPPRRITAAEALTTTNGAKVVIRDGATALPRRR